MKKLFLSIAIILTVSVVYSADLFGQDKKVLTLEDAMLWRSHQTALSPDGEWYTVLYSLMEKPDDKKSAKKDSTQQCDSLYEAYGENLKTDVLYIYSTQSGLKYEISKGSGPAFSDNSDWIAYRINKDADPKKKEKKMQLTELKNLKTGLTRQYESSARFQFPDGTNYFISSDKTSLLIYDLNNLREHFIGNIGGYLVDKKTSLIAYTIKTKDMRGNGIYIYNPDKMTTRTLVTGNYIYSDLAWNPDRNGLAAIRYKKDDKEVDSQSIDLLTINGIGSKKIDEQVFKVDSTTGLPQPAGLAIDSSGLSSNITWLSNDRLLVSTHEYPVENENDKKVKKQETDESTVSVWHWKDEKLLSQQMTEASRKKFETYKTLFLLNNGQAIPLTGEELPGLRMSRNTGNWAVGTDNRAYISDWDVRKNDLYRINLTTGEKSLIEKEYSGSIEISPDGENLILWVDGQFWSYNFSTDQRENLTQHLDLSFIDQENDHWGQQTNYGFAGWIKGQDAIILNHKFDLWLIPLDPKEDAINLTHSLTASEPVRFRLDNRSFMRESEIQDRYIDLNSSLRLSAFHTKTKHAGYYELKKNKIEKLVFEPASFGGSRWGSSIVKAKKSDVILFKKGDFKSYPETYISDVQFSEPRQITTTNPQQENYHWGNRILIDYTNDDGVPLQGLLSIPDSYEKRQKLPMVVYSYEKLSDGRYGYPTPSIGGARICEMMYVSDAYLVLQPDIHFNVGTPHSDMHECLDAAVAKVIELGYADENAVGYEGFSYGGHTGMYISTQINKFAAIAAGAGVSNLVQGFNIDIVGDGSNEQDYYMVGQGRLGVDPATGTDMYIRESAVFNAETMDTPLLLFHGTTDNVVQWEHSFGFYSILRYLKKPVVFLSYHGEGHGLRQKANRIDIQNRLKEYFDHYLKGKEAGKWINDGIPYKLEEPNAKDKAKGSLPKWK